MAETTYGRIAWRPAVVWHVRPRLARAAARAAMVLVLVPLAIEAAPILGGAPPSGALAIAAAWARGLYVLAALAAGIALVLGRGVGRPLAVAVDRRSFFVGTADRLRRIPRWQVAGATVRPPDRSIVVVQLGTGEIYRLKVADEMEARSLAAILAAAPRRRQSDDD